MNSASKSRFEDRSIDQSQANIINAYDLAGIEEMDPALGIMSK